MTDVSSLDTAHHFHPNTNPRSFAKDGPVMVDSAQGVYVDIGGKRYLDMLSGMGCVNVGYGNEKIARAIYDASLGLSFTHSFAAMSNPYLARLSEKLASLTGGVCNRFFFSSTGSDANESAVKMIWRYWALQGQPERRIILSREYGYHGNTIVATSMTGLHHYHHQFGLPLGGITHHVKTSYPFRDGLPSAESARKAADALEEKILELGPENIAAFFAEPVQGAGGIIMPGDGYFQLVRAVCDKYGVLLVSDEVVTGFGKTGQMFGYQAYQFRPDLVVMAKGITSAYFPLAAVGLGHAVESVLTAENADFEHGYTNCGHPAGCAAALANIDFIESEKLLDHVNDILSPAISRRLAALGKHPAIGEVRQLGVLAAIEFKVEDADYDHATIGTDVGRAAFARGLILRDMGSILGFVIPLITSKDEIEQVFDIVEAAISDVVDG